MSLDIGDALKNGFSDSLTRNGLTFVAISYVLTVLSTVGTQSAMKTWFPADMAGPGIQQTMPLAMGGPAALWGLVSLLAWIGTSWLMMGVIRSFVNNRTDEFNTDYFTRNAAVVILNLLVGGIVFSLAVGLGLILLVVPGIYLAVSLIFWNVYVAEMDQNFIEAFKNSWSLTEGNKLDLFLLGIAVLIAGLVIGLIFGIPSTVIGFMSPAVASLISNIGNAFATVFGLATLVNAYQQLQ